jgi:glycosyltransferase involved in cell wall biosynthesis
VTTRAARFRVGLITYALYGGGVETHLFRLGRELHRCGFDVEILTTVEPGPWFGHAGRFGLEAIHVPFRAPIPIVHVFRVASFLRSRNYRAIFLAHAKYAQAGLGLLPNDVLAFPMLLNDAGFAYRVGFGHSESWNALIAVSPKIHHVARTSFPTRSVVLIPNGVDVPSGESWSCRRPFGRPFRLLYVGRLHHGQKGVLFLPEILARCVEHGLDTVLTVVGDGPDRDRLVESFRQKGLAGHVHWCGTLPHEHLDAEYLGSHVLVMPSFYEGGPVAPLEAQACGCVPVMPLLPGTTDSSIENGMTGLLVPRNSPEDFAQAISKLAGNSSLWEQMSRTGHQRIEREFGVSDMGRRYADLLEQGLNGAFPLPCRRQKVPDLSILTAGDFKPFHKPTV